MTKAPARPGARKPKKAPARPGASKPKVLTGEVITGPPIPIWKPIALPKPAPTGPTERGHKGLPLRQGIHVFEAGVGLHRPGYLKTLGPYQSLVQWQNGCTQVHSNTNLRPL